MLRNLWTALTQPFRRTPQPFPSFTVVMTAQCRYQLTEQLRESVQIGYEGIVVLCRIDYWIHHAGTVGDEP